MLQTPGEYFIRVSQKNNTESKEIVKYVFELSDKVSLWIIGISLGALSLLLSNIADILPYMSVINLKTVLIFLFVSGLCGILYRVVYVFYFIYTNEAFRIMDAYLSEDERQDTESVLTGMETYVKLIELNQQFRNLNTDGFIKEYNEADVVGREQLYNNLVVWYINGVRAAKEDFDWTKNDISEAYNTYLGIDKKKFYKVHSTKPLRLSKYACIVLYLTFMLSFFFAIAFFLFTVKFPD